MTRRTFLTEFLKKTITTAVAPQIVTHGLHLVQRKSGIVEARINPNWINAPYEVQFIWSERGSIEKHVENINELTRRITHNDPRVDPRVVSFKFPNT